MNVTLKIDGSQLFVINNLMAELDSIEFTGLKKNLKTIVSICIELREKLLKKQYLPEPAKKLLN